MNYAGIIHYDIANGVGIRESLFVSGCRNNCPGCFNKDQQDFNYGNEFSEDVMNDLLEHLSEPHCKGLSILGGDPMEPENAAGLVPLINAFKKLKEEGKDLWVYTGYLYENLIELPFGDPRKKLLLNTDVLVDGPFVLEKKDVRLKFRGSSNQRVIDIQKSIGSGEIIKYLE